MTAAAAKPAESVLIGIEDWMFDDLMALFKSAYEESPVMKEFSYSESRIAGMLQSAIQNVGVFSKVSVDLQTKRIEGLIIASASSVYYSEEGVTNTIALYVHRDLRQTRVAASLIAAYEAWAKRIGAKKVFISDWSGIADKNRAKQLETQGWIMAGQNMVKPVGEK